MTHAARVGCALLGALFCLAPTPGDVGGCGQEAQLLDAPTFFATQKAIDCERCNECGLVSSRCADACSDDVPFASSFPEGCVPLVHDGEVCLRALLHSSCDEYAPFISDTTPTVPSECAFCPLEDAP